MAYATEIRNWRATRLEEIRCAVRLVKARNDLDKARAKRKKAEKKIPPAVLKKVKQEGSMTRDDPKKRGGEK